MGKVMSGLLLFVVLLVILTEIFFRVTHPVPDLTWSEKWGYISSSTELPEHRKLIVIGDQSLYPAISQFLGSECGVGTFLQDNTGLATYWAIYEYMVKPLQPDHVIIVVNANDFKQADPISGIVQGYDPEPIFNRYILREQSALFNWLQRTKDYQRIDPSYGGWLLRDMVRLGNVTIMTRDEISYGLTSAYVPTVLVEGDDYTFGLRLLGEGGCFRQDP